MLGNGRWPSCYICEISGQKELDQGIWITLLELVVLWAETTLRASLVEHLTQSSAGRDMDRGLAGRGIYHDCMSRHAARIKATVERSAVEVYTVER
jgi:hypothetical protein